MPKEIRNPKSDWRAVLDEAEREDSAFGNWGDEPGGDSMVLREGGTPSPVPLRDLMERTAIFGEAIILFAKKIPHTPENIRLISQLVGAGTSVGANYCEADDSVSGKDFKKSIGTCRKESKETMFFLRMIGMAEEGFEGRGSKALERGEGVEPYLWIDMEEMI